MTLGSPSNLPATCDGHVWITFHSGAIVTTGWPPTLRTPIAARARLKIPVDKLPSDLIPQGCVLFPYRSPFSKVPEYFTEIRSTGFAELTFAEVALEAFWALTFVTSWIFDALRAILTKMILGTFGLRSWERKFAVYLNFSTKSPERTENWSKSENLLCGWG